MRNNINETLINSIKKTHFHHIIFKEKKKDINLKMNKNSIYKDKLDTLQNLNLSPLALSYAPEFRTIRTKNNLFNKIDINQEKDVNDLTNKLGIKSNSVYRGNKLKIVKNKFSYSRISTNNTFESNNEAKNKKNLFGTIQPHVNAHNNLFFEHKKIEFLNTLNDKKNKVASLENDSSINYENPNKYKTIFTKFNSRIIKNKNILDEPNYFFELFSSKYNKNKERKEERKEEKKEEAKNEEIKKDLKKEEKEEEKKGEVKKEGNKQKEIKLVFKSGEREKTKKLSCSIKKTSQKYLKTETNINRLPLNRKTYNVNFPNCEHIISLNNLFKPIFYEDKKTQKLNLKLILKKINDKSFLRLVPISNHLLNNKIKNRKNDISLDKLSPKKRCSYKKINGVKYSAINLNMLTQIPNRVEYINCPGSEFNYFRKNKNLKMNKKKKVNSLKQNLNTNNLKLLRKQLLSNNYSHNLSLRKQRKNLDNNILLTLSKNHMHKTFYKNNAFDFNDEEIIKKNNRTISLKKKYILSSRINRKKNGNILKMKKSPNIDINFISI